MTNTKSLDRTLTLRPFIEPNTRQRERLRAPARETSGTSSGPALSSRSAGHVAFDEQVIGWIGRVVADLGLMSSDVQPAPEVPPGVRRTIDHVLIDEPLAGRRLFDAAAGIELRRD